MLPYRLPSANPGIDKVEAYDNANSLEDGTAATSSLLDMADLGTEEFETGLDAMGSHERSVVEELNHSHMQTSTHQIDFESNVTQTSAHDDGYFFSVNPGLPISSGHSFPGLEYPSDEVAATTCHSFTNALPPQAVIVPEVILVDRIPQPRNRVSLRSNENITVDGRIGARGFHGSTHESLVRATVLWGAISELCTNQACSVQCGPLQLSKPDGYRSQRE